MVKYSDILLLFILLSKLKTKSLGLDNFEILVAQRRALKKQSEDNQEVVDGILAQHNVKFDEKDPRFFDSECKEEDTKAVNEKLKEFDKKTFETRKFLTKKNLQSIKDENNLSIEEYELLTEAFLKVTPDKEEGSKRKR